VLQLAGRLLITPLSGTNPRLPLALLTALMFAIHAFGVALLAVQTDWGVWGFVLLYGSSNGAITIMRAALTAELFDTRVYGVVSGGVSLVVTLVSALMPFVAGVLHEASGDYRSTLWLLVLTTVLASVAVLGAQRRKDSA
jgi:cyanate permease